MGKRKRRADHHNNKTPPLAGLFMPYSSPMDSLPKEKSPHSVDSSTIKRLSSIMDIMDSSLRVSNVHHSPAHHYHNHSRSVFVRHPRHFYGRQYSRRNSAGHAETSSSRGKGTPLCDEKLSFKLTSHQQSDSGCHKEGRDKSFRRPERIRSSSLATDTVTPDVVKMVCGICQKLLRKKPYILGNTLSSSDVSVVAVLVCGHVYHADCLEQRTCYEDRRDPACPLCLSMLLPLIDA